MVNKRKDICLGMNASTASTRLRKMIMYDMAVKLNLDVCYRCGTKIERVQEFSVEHKTDWLNSDNPYETFFDLDNIAFSHLKCNTRSTSYHSPNLVLLCCDNCGKNFTRLPSVDKIRKKRGITKTFCSMSCRSLFYNKNR